MDALFGTDGVRGVANVDPITPEALAKLGQAMVYAVRRGGEKVHVVMGKDTRISGDMLEAALAAGICSAGVDVLQVGIVPTPGLAYLTRLLKADLGITISASHNPFEDNGIKLFGQSGFKLNESQEREIEQLFFNLPSDTRSPAKDMGRIIKVAEGGDYYLSFLKGTLPPRLNLSGFKIALDCANGASYELAPRLLQELGAEVVALNAQPDGININRDCGSQHPEQLQATVAQVNASVGLCFDGDADRLIAIDEQGIVRDGDYLLAILADDLVKGNQLPHRRVVATVMSNLGLEISLKRLGCTLIRTQVGDRHVVEAMLRDGAYLGGEQSGHVVFLHHHTTGDGIITALQLLSVMWKRQKPLSELCCLMEKFPQILVNVPTTHGQEPLAIPQLRRSIEEFAHQLGEGGRIVVRRSGTEPLVRVMVEGEDEASVSRIARELAGSITLLMGADSLEGRDGQ